VGEVIQNVSSFAVWGSLGANVVLGVFMWVQAGLDVGRRWRYAAFAMACCAIAVLDFLHPELERDTYEMLRVFSGSAYGVAVLGLLGARRRWIVLAALGLPLLGLGVWGFWRPELATTFVFPAAFGIAALAHGREYWKRHGYASCVLCSYAMTLSLMCGLYYAVMATGDIRMMILGYAHFTQVSVVSVLLGWVQLPRELRGQAPVKVQFSQAAVFFAAVLVTEIGVQLGLLTFRGWPPVLYLGSGVLQLSVTFLLYFYHRHQLVIHTDNVARLLEERTGSLRVAQKELANQNEIQAQKLEEQAGQLQAKAEVIDRQRRLELAAQTAGEAAHDIQNLVSPLLTQVTRLAQVMDDPAERRKVASGMKAQVEQLLALNGQMLALSRRGRKVSHPVHLNELLHELPGHFPDRELVIDAQEQAWVKGSWSQLSRAVSNLVVNAFDASPPDGRVHVRCGVEQVERMRRCHLGFLNPGRYAYIAVEDHGSGIPKAILEQIFEPFFSSKDGSQGSGSGLGLSIVNAVVEDHRGVLDLTTGPEGTCFTIYLPADEIPGPSRAEPAGGGETIMIVDDDEAILRRYGAFLEAKGYSVITAGDGTEALRILQTEEADLLLLDLKMPKKTGLETFFGALHMRPGIRAIVHSSFISGEDVLRLQQMGVTALLQKPASREEVLRTVREILDDQPVRRPAVDS
jgi:signal transduction histidine kinase/ActR/RegA family two-component response regulator